MATSIVGKFAFASMAFALSSTAAAQLYVGGAFGSTTYQDADYFGVGDKSTAFELSAGWRLQETLALEASYLNLGDVEDFELGSDINVSGITFSGKAFLPIAPQVDLYAKMGIYLWQMDEVYRSRSYHLDEGEDLIFGGGLAFKLDSVDLNLEYRTLDIYDMGTSIVSAGVTFQF